MSSSSVVGSTPVAGSFVATGPDTVVVHQDVPNAAFINQYAKSANLANNYFAVAHPSLTNYLEIAGG